MQISSDEVNLATRTAKLGGKKAHQMKNNVKSEKKSDGTVVTEADKTVESIITENLRQHSDYPVLAEEGTYSNVSPTDDCWIIDPIDGTNNYESGHPTYCTSVCLVKNKRPYACAVYASELDHLFYAEYGEGAYLNDEQISVSDVEDGEESTLISSGYYADIGHENLVSVTPWVQRVHSAVYSMCYIAAGWVDGGIFSTLYSWDLASGYLLIEEAGGRTENLVSQQSEWDDVMNGGVLSWNGSSSLQGDLYESLSTSVREQLQQEIRNL